MSVRRTSFVVVVGVVALAAALVLGNGALSAKAQTSTPTPIAAPAPNESTIARTITVVGRGEVKVKPELATTTVGVDVQGATVEAAMEDAQARMTAILAALKQLGIADKDIQTSNFSISFERQVPEPRVAATAQATPGAVEPPAGFYRLSNMVTVTIRDLTKVAEVLDTAVKAGANNVWGIAFGLDNTDALEAQAREAAVKDALARAQTLAQLNGVQVGEVVSVSEVVGNTPGPMYDMAVRAQGGGGTPVEPGEVAFSTQIQIVYSIR